MRAHPASRVFVALLLVLLAAAGALVFVASEAVVAATAAGEPFPAAEQWPLIVHFFDVGQGDAVLFQGEDFTILIDAGRHDAADVVPHLLRAGVEFIDLFIGTHPHADHIGQCAPVMRQFPVGEVWLSGDVHTTLTFERCIDAILASEAGYHEPRAGEVYEIASVRIEVLHPAALTGNLNNNSIVVRIVYGDVAFLMTGDAEVEAEATMVRSGRDISAQVLKLGHHGSRTSSTAMFLQAVRPEIAVYSAGRDNPYGHPHAETLRTTAALGIPLYGTDVFGTIRVATNGQEYAVFVERTGTMVAADWPDADTWQALTPWEETLSSPPDALSPSADALSPAADALSPAADALSPAADALSPALCTSPLVNLNNTPIDELMRIVHVGPTIAARIVEARPFESVEDLLRVSGIGTARLADILAQGLACVDVP